MNYKEYTQEDFWNMLPISKEQREAIIEDFIETDKYDKVDEHLSDDEYDGDITDKYKEIHKLKQAKENKQREIFINTLKEKI